MGDIYSDGKGSGPVAWARVRVRCSVWCTGKIGLCFDVGNFSDVRVMEKLTFRITVRHG